jgi:hypothetical protein
MPSIFRPHEGPLWYYVGCAIDVLRGHARADGALKATGALHSIVGDNGLAYGS